MHWESLLDLIGIALCLPVIAYLVCNRIRYGRLTRSYRPPAVPANFNTEVMARMFRQRALESLDAVAERIRAEQEHLQQWNANAMHRQPDETRVADDEKPAAAGKPAACHPGSIAPPETTCRRRGDAGHAAGAKRLVPERETRPGEDAGNRIDRAFPYREHVWALLERGVGAAEVAQQVGRPRAEIELYGKLKRCAEPQ